MKTLLFLFLTNLVIADAQVNLNITKQSLNEQINQFISGLNAPVIALRTNIQNHFDNVVRAFVEPLQVFNINANRVFFPVADTNRSSLQACLVNIRNNVESMMAFLRNNASSPVFDFAISTVTRIEADLKNQTDELKRAIDNKTDAACLAFSGVGLNNLNIRYSNYSSSLWNCIGPVGMIAHNEVFTKFAPKFWPALALFNIIRRTLRVMMTQAQIKSFIAAFCTPTTIQVFNDVKNAAEQIMVAAGKSLTICYDRAKPFLPALTPFVAEVNKCK